MGERPRRRVTDRLWEVPGPGEPPHPDGSQMCRIDIHDTGQGIPRQGIEALTQAEERALSHGRGLGLWLVSAVLEQSGGQLEFPDTGNGTTVRLWLPGP